MKIPQIIIIEQLTPGHERFANDKVQKDVGVCVKKKAFPITISTENKQYDLSKVNFSVSLLYDNNSNSSVEFIEQAPVTFKSKISKDKTTATLDLTILVLSSQMENSLFVLKVRAENKKDSKDYSECLSIPLKVVSKVTQLQTKAKKRTRNRSTPTKEMFINAMEQLDQGQEKHSQLLATLLEQSKQQTEVLQLLLQDEVQEITNTINNDDSILNEEEFQPTSPNKRVKIEIESNTDEVNLKDCDLEVAFKDLFETFKDMECESFNEMQFNSNSNEQFSPFSFEEEVNSESPNQINSYEHSDDLPNHSQHRVSLENTIGNSIDFGAFPNLFNSETNFL